MKRFIPLISIVLLLSSCTGTIYSVFIKSSDIIYDNETGSPVISCNERTHYEPDTANLSHTPMKYVRVNFHFMRNPDDKNIFNQELANIFAEKIVSCGNYKLQVNAKMNLPPGNNTPALPVRYRYKITADGNTAGDNGVYIHNEADPQLAYFYNDGPHLNIFDKDVYNKYGIRKNDVLNVFVLSHPPDSMNSKTYQSKVQGVGYSDVVKVAIPHNGFSSYNSQKKTYDHMGKKYCGILNHEIGHSLGLYHSWNTNDGCDDTPQNPGCWGKSSQPPCNGAVSNNMMDYNSVQDAISPCQLSIMLQKMSSPNSQQRKIVERTWCQYNPEATIRIQPFQMITWNSVKDLEGDLIIENGGRLIVHCTVSLPKGAKVQVHQGGTLIIDGGTITNNCGDQWEGIEIKSKGGRKGIVVIRNGGKIEHAKNAV